MLTDRSETLAVNRMSEVAPAAFACSESNGPSIKKAEIRLIAKISDLRMSLLFIVVLRLAVRSKNRGLGSSFRPGTARPRV